MRKSKSDMSIEELKGKRLSCIVMAFVLGITPQALGAYDMKRDPDGRYDLVSTCSSYCQMLRERSRERTYGSQETTDIDRMRAEGEAHLAHWRAVNERNKSREWKEAVMSLAAQACFSQFSESLRAAAERIRSGESAADALESIADMVDSCDAGKASLQAMGEEVEGDN